MRKLTIKEARRAFAEYGHELLEKEYVGASTPMRYRCGGCGKIPDKGLMLNNCRKGQQCRDCRYKKSGISNSFTIDEAKATFAEKRHELLEEEYVDCKTPMRYRCGGCGNIPESGMTLDNCKHGHQCWDCGRKNSGIAQSFTIEEARKVFTKYGHQLLEEVYVNSHYPMKYRCSGCGNVPEKGLALSDCQAGKQCKRCGIKKMSITQSFTIEEARRVFTKYGHQLLEEVYVNCFTPMCYRCGGCGNIPLKGMNLNNCQGGKQCWDCGHRNTGIARSFTLNEAKVIFAEGGHELLEEKYVNNNTPMRYRCGGCGNIPLKGMSLINCQAGCQCRVCGNKNQGISNSWADLDDLRPGDLKRVLDLLEAKLNENQRD
jgi:hypothetical protein